MEAGSPARAVLWGAAALLLATVVLAPVIGVGRCLDSSDPEKSFCESYTQSLAGFPVTVWPWAAVAAIIVVVTTVAFVARHRRASA
ncbi:hypothetical protein [Microbacterium oleivorans]|uniref:hypothetical protein n=1 Tax=Microbacterium oleivorans TaxID=273677 RepID=UPI0020405846|nr:hypothetical protein [Microbacterium oleivorans]MCM3694824.1 hypothetical protein [Microbacterium oleivorans]